ncbi:unnamed protein product [Prorocentrum cordatum]|uniref:Uncharacterized protein n=1 Tax=Prorocentrum cordatum TaxID=2364126 RepID=A0ABN9VVF3_9DINO|nr:unnamed protein product [Polarella glacialis]
MPPAGSCKWKQRRPPSLDRTRGQAETSQNAGLRVCWGLQQGQWADCPHTPEQLAPPRETHACTHTNKRKARRWGQGQSWPQQTPLERQSELNYSRAPLKDNLEEEEEEEQDREEHEESYLASTAPPLISNTSSVGPAGEGCGRKKNARLAGCPRQLIRRSAVGRSPAILHCQDTRLA